jgi:hypothetical protein
MPPAAAVDRTLFIQDTYIHTYIHTFRPSQFISVYFHMGTSCLLSACVLCLYCCRLLYLFILLQVVIFVYIATDCYICLYCYRLSYMFILQIVIFVYILTDCYICLYYCRLLYLFILLQIKLYLFILLQIKLYLFILLQIIFVYNATD